MSEIIKVREMKAREAIKRTYDLEEGHFGGAEMFISHHLEEIESSYWLKRTGESKPDHEKVLNLLVLSQHWDEDLAFDFTLPEDVTNYVICVRFDENDEVVEIVMES